MPPRTPLSTPLRAWRCPQCTTRTFTSTPRPQQVGPEHPRYIAVPEPPQQTSPERKFIKGRLPVPRDVFAGAQGKDKASHEWVDRHTKAPLQRGGTKAAVAEGSREAWKGRLSEMRRRNLREGLASLRVRRDREQRVRTARAARHQEERAEMLNRPEREDERLTAPSHSLDLQALYNGLPADPTRGARIEHKLANLAAKATSKQAERLDSLHTLYLNARHFIVTPQQLDTAVDEAFGTPANPVTFDVTGGQYGQSENAASVWALGKPERVQDMLNRANRQGSRSAVESAGGYEGVNGERIRRIAETLTGGKMGGG